jgi:2-oxo-4-hydroxy-4-carboxy-5-ureidoimidazoline decarboxylase
MRIDELNACDKTAFVSALGWIFEDSPWVAERASQRRPFGSLDSLHAAMTQVVADAPETEQLALLRAHPDLGTRARISEASTGEQRGAGLDQLTPDEFARLRRLNDEYRGRFGFPFLFAVKGSTTHDVLAALESRVTRSRDEEFAEALQQVYKIARFRLEDTFGTTR